MAPRTKPIKIPSLGRRVQNNNNNNNNNYRRQRRAVCGDDWSRVNVSRRRLCRVPAAHSRIGDNTRESDRAVYCVSSALDGPVRAGTRAVTTTRPNDLGAAAAALPD